jgi:hypothetical protein
LKFIVHPSFDYASTELLRVFDGGCTFEHLYDRYPEGARDEEWVACAGKERPRPTILIADDGILKNAVTRQTLQEAKCTFVYFVGAWRNMRWDDKAISLLKQWSSIREMVKSSTRPCVITVASRRKLQRQDL